MKYSTATISILAAVALLLQPSHGLSSIALSSVAPQQPAFVSGSGFQQPSASEFSFPPQAHWEKQRHWQQQRQGQLETHLHQYQQKLEQYERGLKEQLQSHYDQLKRWEPSWAKQEEPAVVAKPIVTLAAVQKAFTQRHVQQHLINQAFEVQSQTPQRRQTVVATKAAPPPPPPTQSQFPSVMKPQFQQPKLHLDSIDPTKFGVIGNVQPTKPKQQAVLQEEIPAPSCVASRVGKKLKAPRQSSPFQQTKIEFDRIESTPFGAMGNVQPVQPKQQQPGLQEEILAPSCVGTLAGKHFQLEEREDAQGCITDVMLCHDGTIAFGETDGPPPKETRGSWSMDDHLNIVNLELHRTFGGGHKGSDVGEFSFGVTRTFRGELTSVGALMGVEGSAHKMDDIFGDVKVGYFSMIDTSHISRDDQQQPRMGVRSLMA